MQNYGKDMYVSKWNLTDAVRCWSWPGWEGKPTAIEVYSDAEEAELLVNGRSLGRKRVGNDFKQFYCRWETVYEPGEVVAVAYIGGQEVGRDLLQTAGASGLVLKADRTALRAGSDELCFLEIELRDHGGRSEERWRRQSYGFRRRVPSFWRAAAPPIPVPRRGIRTRSISFTKAGCWQSFGQAGSRAGHPSP